MIRGRVFIRSTACSYMVSSSCTHSRQAYRGVSPSLLDLAEAGHLDPAKAVAEARAHLVFVRRNQGAEAICRDTLGQRGPDSSRRRLICSSRDTVISRQSALGIVQVRNRT
ncbi:hypothetical protein QFZ49_007303 [Streptomyces turgidiscabies]|uniref:Uncharacterized protein n=1 Tax=Streptomyces turgidiscabies TaxID=85558 RepID=A0ABU0RZB6_9ACTN|nr:hypothetical protein [Streptomyces turgidiscabies]